jgi:hypothetical protein
MSHPPHLPKTPPPLPPPLPQHTRTEYMTIHTPTHDGVNMQQGEVRPDLIPENHSIPAFAKSAEPSMWDSSPFRQIPITPAIKRHGLPMDTPSADQEGLDTIDPPRSRATSAQSRATITSRGLSRAPSRATSVASTRPRARGHDSQRGATKTTAF